MLEVPQEEIDMMTGIAVRRLGITASPDVLIQLVMRTADRCDACGKTVGVHEVFEDLINDYLARGRRFS